MSKAALPLEMRNRAVEVKLVAQRRAGEVLRAMQLRGGDRRSSGRDDTRLEDMGIAKEESSRWQREASLPEEDFREYVRRTTEHGKKLTSRNLLRLARVHARGNRCPRESLQSAGGGLRKLARQGMQFGCIHVIPPWPEGRTTKANISCLVQELLDLPVEPVAAERAHLHLWTPPEMLEDGLRVVRAWGFHYRASLVRTKRPPRSPAATGGRPTTFFCSACGENMEFRDRSLLSWMDPHTSEAAESLREIRCVIERASPEPYLELFGNKATRGWTVLSP